MRHIEEKKESYIYIYIYINVKIKKKSKFYAYIESECGIDSIASIKITLGFNLTYRNRK